MKIEQLLEKYFAGRTTCAEERQIQEYFNRPHIPDEWQPYRPMFQYLHQERLRRHKPVIHLPRRLWWALGGAAACILLALGVIRLLPSAHPEDTDAYSYVVIDGQRYTDRQLMAHKAQESLEMVSFTDEEIDNLIQFHP